MEPQPPVSCFRLTYGRPRLLEESIHSFLQQDYAGSKEMIVLNDHSGQIQLEKGEDGAAIATYRQAVRENPRRINTHRALAAAYRRLGRGEEAKLEDEAVRRLFSPAAAE